MTDDISDEELVDRMERWAQFEDAQDRLVPFRDACTDIVRALGSEAPEALADLPAAVGDVVAERDRLRAVVEAAHEVLAGLDWSTGGGKKLIPVTALTVLRDGLAQLDAGRDMDGTRTEGDNA